MKSLNLLFILITNLRRRRWDLYPLENKNGDPTLPEKWAFVFNPSLFLHCYCEELSDETICLYIKGHLVLSGVTSRQVVSGGNS